MEITLEQVERLREKADVSYGQAKAALEYSGGNLLDAIIYLVYLDSLSPEIVRSLHEAGYYVDGSIVNTPERMKAAIELGVDLIESDHPLEMMKLYEEMTR